MISLFSDLTLSGQEPEWMQEDDILLRVHDYYSLCIAVWKHGAVALSSELRDKISELVGKKVAILGLDGRYHVPEAF